ncbi:MAG TPA: allophanate hydrolase [Alphaproteobacteria bacterium]|jgi:allophanate hydrolase|nr:allophanate hydrolase [Alphaproteobacteria bacterium]
MNQPIDIVSLTDAYMSGALTPAQVLDDVFARIAAMGERPVWISLVPRERIAARLAEIESRKQAGETMPLCGIPFAVKDNIDVAGIPTTAACPDFAYVPERSATVVEKLEAAGAIVVGKTNLDQFATGLVGTRSPFGIPASVFDPAYISGGSSSGSAVAVAAGLVSFSLGTDTAGSGRVPAGFNNIVGLKPTKGLISTRGVVPACRSQDCVSIFAATVDEAVRVLEAAQGFDREDDYSRASLPVRALPAAYRFGVPSEPLEFFGDEAAAALYAQSVEKLRALGGTPVAIDFAPFRDAARLLYQGPWVAERLAALRQYDFERPDSIHPVVWQIVGGAERITAADGFAAIYRLAALTRAAEAEWEKMDVLLLPTTGTTYTIEALLADPVGLNSNLGLYTNFVNLMDLSAIAVPGGFRPNGLPFGVTLIGRAFEDRQIAGLADRLHRTLGNPTVGGTGLPLPPPSPVPQKSARVQVAVVGAHLTGQPLNWQLTDRKATFLRMARTAPGYRLYALAGTVPAKPGLIRDGGGQGLVELEIWEMDFAAFGSFVAEIPSPLGIGTVTLEDGGTVKCFLGEPYAIAGAEDITAFGGWRNWLNRRRA